jgi:hypothetical protein
VLSLREGRLRVQLYHCKASSAPASGHRVGDLYEVVSQATKSVAWALKHRVVAHIRRRYTGGKGGHRFAKGTLDDVERLIGDMAAAQIDYEFIAVQPGLKKQQLPARFGQLLAASSDHMVRGGFQPLRVLAS